MAVAVSKKDRKILGFNVSEMPATGHLARISRKKHRKRSDNRWVGLTTLFDQLATVLPQKNGWPNQNYYIYFQGIWVGLGDFLINFNGFGS
ncbi:MAG: hypothetical protein ACO3K7_06660 [Candidatus Marinamargulisbacteria bacterium]